KPSSFEQDKPQAQEKPEGLNEWWKKNKESAEDGSKKNQTPGKNLQAEDKVALNNPNPGNVGIKVDNLSTGFPPIYFESIKNKIQRYWFPTSNLMTVVAFSIKSNGEVAGIQVEKGSGNSFFDRSAIRAVMDSTPLPPFPEGFKEKDLNVHFTFIGEAVR
ncbi:MAG: energy transducer TonB, partial [Nitrospirota bacterium]